MTAMLPGPRPTSPSRSPGGAGRRAAGASGAPAALAPALRPAAPRVALLGVGWATRSSAWRSCRRRSSGCPSSSARAAGVRRASTTTASILGDPYFWDVLRRSVVFCLVNVALTLGAGHARRAAAHAGSGKRMRTAVSSALLFAWAIPALTATRGLAVDLRPPLRRRELGRSPGSAATSRATRWLSSSRCRSSSSPRSIVVWMGIPFVAFTMYAGMTQIPGEVIEAASIDGAGAWQRFRDVTLAQPPAAVRRAHRPQHPLGPAGVHPDLRAAAGGWHHPRDQPARRLGLPLSVGATTSAPGPPWRSSWWPSRSC